MNPKMKMQLGASIWRFCHRWHIPLGPFETNLWWCNLMNTLGKKGRKLLVSELKERRAGRAVDKALGEVPKWK